LSRKKKNDGFKKDMFSIGCASVGWIDELNHALTRMGD
jgi:hypothetical protein